MKLTNQNYFSKSDDELRFILRDASEAADCARGFDDRAESKYLEQIDDATTVLAQRARSRLCWKLDDEAKLVLSLMPTRRAS
jgi:hypothetical protein